LNKQYKFTIPGTLPGLNEYINAERGNRYQAAKLRRQTEEMIVMCIWEQMPGLVSQYVVEISEPVHIEYHWYEPNRRRDKDNIAFAKKFVQDALVKAGVLANDGWQEIVSFADRFGIDKDNPRVEVVIERAGKGGVKTWEQQKESNGRRSALRG